MFLNKKNKAVKQEKMGLIKTEKRLLKLVKTKGKLVTRMPIGTDFLVTSPSDENKYKKDLGAVCKKNWHGVITNVYIIYEDYDGSIKYYDYPQITEKIAKKIRNGKL